MNHLPAFDPEPSRFPRRIELIANLIFGTDGQMNDLRTSIARSNSNWSQIHSATQTIHESIGLLGSATVPQSIRRIAGGLKEIRYGFDSTVSSITSRLSQVQERLTDCGITRTSFQQKISEFSNTSRNLLGTFKTDTARLHGQLDVSSRRINVLSERRSELERSFLEQSNLFEAVDRRFSGHFDQLQTVISSLANASFSQLASAINSENTELQTTSRDLIAGVSLTSQRISTSISQLAQLQSRLPSSFSQSLNAVRSSLDSELSSVHHNADSLCDSLTQHFDSIVGDVQSSFTSVRTDMSASLLAQKDIAMKAFEALRSGAAAEAEHRRAHAREILDKLQKFQDVIAAELELQRKDIDAVFRGFVEGETAKVNEAVAPVRQELEPIIEIIGCLDSWEAQVSILGEALDALRSEVIRKVRDLKNAAVQIGGEIGEAASDLRAGVGDIESRLEVIEQQGKEFEPLEVEELYRRVGGIRAIAEDGIAEVEGEIGQAMSHIAVLAVGEEGVEGERERESQRESEREDGGEELEVPPVGGDLEELVGELGVDVEARPISGDLENLVGELGVDVEERPIGEDLEKLVGELDGILDDGIRELSPDGFRPPDEDLAFNPEDFRIIPESPGTTGGHTESILEEGDTTAEEDEVQEAQEVQVDEVEEQVPEEGDGNDSGEGQNVAGEEEELEEAQVDVDLDLDVDVDEEQVPEEGERQNVAEEEEAQVDVDADVDVDEEQVPEEGDGQNVAEEDEAQVDEAEKKAIEEEEGEGDSLQGEKADEKEAESEQIHVSDTEEEEGMLEEKEGELSRNEAIPSEELGVTDAGNQTAAIEKEEKEEEEEPPPLSSPDGLTPVNKVSKEEEQLESIHEEPKGDEVLEDANSKVIHSPADPTQADFPIDESLGEPPADYVTPETDLHEVPEGSTQNPDTPTDENQEPPTDDNPTDQPDRLGDSAPSADAEEDAPEPPSGEEEDTAPEEDQGTEEEEAIPEKGPGYDRSGLLSVR
jgi:hypothetical protein